MIERGNGMSTNEQSKNILGYKSIRSLLHQFSIPSMIALVVSSLYNMVDQIFIGHGVGVLGNAATNIAFPITTICLALSFLFGIGGAAQYSLELGKKNHQKAESAVGNTVVLMLIAGVLVFGIVILFLEPLLIFFGSTEDIMPYAYTYTKIISFGIPFFILSTGMSSLIRADGSPKYSMGCMIIGAIVNTILDPIFMFVFHMGIAGAAWATIIGQIISALMALYYLLHFKHVTLCKESFRLKVYNIYTIISLGAAGFFNQLAMMITQVVTNNVLRHYGALSIYGSEIPIASVGIIMKVTTLFMSLIFGIAQGTQPIVSYNFGAQNYQRVKDTYRLAILYTTIISVFTFICFQFFPRQITSFFGNGSEEYFLFSERYFRIYMFFIFINGAQPITSMFFSSIGQAGKSVFISLTRQILFLLPLLIIFPIYMGIDGVLYAGPVADLVSFLLTIYFVYKQFKILDTLAVESTIQDMSKN